MTPMRTAEEWWDENAGPVHPQTSDSEFAAMIRAIQADARRAAIEEAAECCGVVVPGHALSLAVETEIHRRIWSKLLGGGDS